MPLLAPVFTALEAIVVAVLVPPWATDGLKVVAALGEVLALRGARASLAAALATCDSVVCSTKVISKFRHKMVGTSIQGLRRKLNLR